MSGLKWEGDNVTGTYLEYVHVGNSPTGKTLIWDVIGSFGKGGQVRWYAPWRQYAFFPDAYTVWAGRCLTETDEFCKELTKEHNERRKEKRPPVPRESAPQPQPPFDKEARAT